MRLTIATTTAAFFALLALPAAAAAQPRVDPNCSDDRGVDRCSADQQARTREMFGLLSIEQHGEAGAEVRRVFYVDGYGRDMVAISFMRSRGDDPRLYVHFPRRDGQRPPVALQAPVPHELWAEIRRRSEHFDRSLVPVPRQQVSICLHSWVYTVETSEPARANHSPARIRRATEDACQDGLAEVFAGEVQRAALSLLPHCARLDPELHRNPATQLAACNMLTGDRMAAAEVMNRSESFRRARRAEDRGQLAGLFTGSSTIQWGGERLAAGPQAADQWLARLSQGGNSTFFVERAEGLAADRVRLVGSLTRTTQVEGGQTSYHRAPVEMLWVFGPSQSWQIESASVGSWESPRPR